jgi:hypothetical protein
MLTRIKILRMNLRINQMQSNMKSIAVDLRAKDRIVKVAEIDHLAVS